jgi:hypothetical protein
VRLPALKQRNFGKTPSHSRVMWLHRLIVPSTTRNVLTSDPLFSSLDCHNGWSTMILWWKNDRQKWGVVDYWTWQIWWNRYNRVWWYWTVIMVMTNQYLHEQFEEATSAIRRGSHMAYIVMIFNWS